MTANTNRLDGAIIRDANREITPADRHAILDLIEQQAARIAALETKCRLYEASLNKSDAEADGLRRDAERYRWLRGSWWYVGPAPEGDLQGVSWDDKNGGQSELDEAIDAALAKQQEKGGSTSPTAAHSCDRHTPTREPVHASQ